MGRIGRRRIRRIVLFIVLILIVIGAVFFFLRSNVIKSFGAEKKTETAVAESEYSSAEKWAEGVISYGGKQYIYNKSLKSYLFMGIDKDGVVEVAEDYQKGGQSDAMFLIVTDSASMEMKIIIINRNTMTPIQIFDVEGNPLGTYEAQICVQHGYGDGKRYSCNLTQQAVENLFYNLPIDGYFSLNVGGVPAINDFVGGVELTVLSGLDYLGDNRLKKGNVITLSGEEALKYLRNRDIDVFGSADMRLERQKQYIGLYVPKFTEKILSDASQALEIYNQVADYTVTNIDAEELFEDLAKYKYNPEEIYEIPGRTITNEKTGFEEYIVDQDAFYKMIIDVFYVEYK